MNKEELIHQLNEMIMRTDSNSAIEVARKTIQFLRRSENGDIRI